MRAVESVGPLPTHARIELAEVGVLTGMWDLDVLRQTEDSATEYNVLVEGPAPVVTVAAEATLRLSGLTGDDTVWGHLTTDGGESC